MNGLQARLDDGEDSFSTPNEKKRRASAEKRLRDAQGRVVKSLDAACDALLDYVRAFDEVHPGVIREYEDGRRRLIRDMAEFSTYLEGLRS